MGQGIIQASFTSGELSPSLYGRVDFQRYYTGLKTCRNFIVRQFGGVSNRPGTKYICEVKDSSKATRLIPFEFNTEQAYVLEFGDQYIRIIKDGGQVVKELADTVAWLTGTAYVKGDFRKQSDVIYYCQSSHTAGTFATDLAAGKWVAQSIYEIPTSYLSADLPLLKYVQSADVMTICHPSYPIMQLSRTGHAAWTLTEFVNTDGPFLDINIDTSKTVSVDAVTGAVTVTAGSDIFAATMVGQMFNIEQAPDSTTNNWEVNTGIAINEIRKAGAHYYQATTAGTTGTFRPDHTDGVAYDGGPGIGWKYLHSGYGTVRITAYTDAQHVTADVLKRLPDNIVVTSTLYDVLHFLWADGQDSYFRITVSGGAFVVADTVTIQGSFDAGDLAGTYQVRQIGTEDILGVTYQWIAIDRRFGCAYQEQTVWTTNPTIKLGVQTSSYKWALGAWGGLEGYPGTTAYFNQRQLFGGSTGQPQTMWLSTINGFKSFATSIPLLDDDAITYKLNSRKANQIRHFVELAELILLTSDGPFMARGGQDGVIAPGKLSTKRQGSSGAAHITPLIVGNHSLYIQEKGGQVRSLGYSLNDDSFVGNDLTVMSSHLFYRYQLVDWAFQQVPFAVAWTVRDDGTLLGLTYMPEQDVIGWHRHDTDGQFEAVACISETTEDALYCIVKRGTKRFIERMSTRYFDTIKDAFFVDCGLTYDGRNSTATTMTVIGGTLWDYTETLTITASSTDIVPTATGYRGFTSADLGDVIIYTDGTTGTAYRLTINGITSTTVVSAVVNKTLPAAYRAARADWTFGRNVMSGLDHLEGKTVDILADGNTVPQQVVTSGTVTLPQAAGVVHIGLPITADFETLDISVAGQNLRDKQKLINHVSLIVEESTGIWCGPDADHLTEYKQRSTENYDQSTGLANEIIDLRIQATWNKQGRVFVRQAKPLPVTILAVIPEVTAGGS
jgi:hypothetical protein